MGKIRDEHLAAGVLVRAHESELLSPPVRGQLGNQGISLRLAYRGGLLSRILRPYLKRLVSNYLSFRVRRRSRMRLMAR